MTQVVPSPGAVSRPHGASPRPTRWSLLMLPVFLVTWFVVGGIVYQALLQGPLGLTEGDLALAAGSVAGWAVEIGCAVVSAIPAIAGVWLAVVALRRGGSGGAWTGLVLNAVCIAFVLYGFADAIRMTYWPLG